MPGHFTFYSEKISNKTAVFDEYETKHAIHVLRYKIGDQIQFTDGKGNYYYGRVKSTNKKQFAADIVKENKIPQLSQITIACGIIKSSDRMDWIVEKCTEMGIANIVFVKTENSERSNVNMERMEKVAISAVKQSHGAWLPKIKVMGYNELLKQEADIKLVAMLHQDAQPIHQVVNEGSMIVAIGPEGDFSDFEKQKLLDNKYTPIMLGNSVLRTETACIAVSAYFSLSK